MKNFSPMMQQYLGIKKDYENYLLFYRLGDFYELFFEDAEVASDALSLTLTQKDSGNDKVPMCGVPHHVGMNYIEKLVNMGFRVALCEQTNEKENGIAVRKVVRTFTTGTIFDEASQNRYIMAITCSNSKFDMAYCDVSTGDFYTAGFESFEQLADEYAKIAPTELIVCSNFASEYQIDENFLIFEIGANAADGLMAYLRKSGLEDFSHFKPAQPYVINDFIYLDRYVRRALELFETQIERTYEGSLLWAIDATKTPMGKRLLRTWLERPLTCKKAITTRADAVHELFSQSNVRKQVRKHLSKIGDLQKFCAKIVYRKINGQDLFRLSKSLKSLADLLDVSSDLKASLNTYFAKETDPLLDISEAITDIFLETACEVDAGGIFSKGYNVKLDQCRDNVLQLESELADYALSQRKETGIKTLKIQQNRILGLYIEVPNSARASIPAHYLPRQSLAGSQRFSTEALKQLEIKIFNARDDSVKLEIALFNDIRTHIVAQIGRMQAVANAVAHFDAVQSLAEIACAYNYARPSFNEEGKMSVEKGRHPVIERFVPNFVKNDVHLNNADMKIALITGPNMAGKSTYMRQTAIISIMAQIGGFVPAAAATLPIFDAVFSRVGAADDLGRGHSTFMVEMTELAHILNLATKNSLILLDEIGRGTGTSDGLSIAMATIEHISQKIGAKTMFATHYHELIIAEGWVNGVINLSMEVDKTSDGVKFLHTVTYGGTGKSYGVFVAELAGVPKEIIERSAEILNKIDLFGSFDENVLKQPKVVDYRSIRERAKRYRIFLEEYGSIIDSDEDGQWTF